MSVFCYLTEKYYICGVLLKFLVISLCIKDKYHLAKPSVWLSTSIVVSAVVHHVPNFGGFNFFASYCQADAHFSPLIPLFGVPES